MKDWTTLRGWIGTRWRGPAPVSQPGAKILAVELTTAPVPAEYQALHTYLEHRYAAVVVLTFGQIEALLGGALPLPASTERDWWTGGAADQPSHSAAWRGAGRTARPNLPARTVTFERLA